MTWHMRTIDRDVFGSPSVFTISLPPSLTLQPPPSAASEAALRAAALFFRRSRTAAFACAFFSSSPSSAATFAVASFESTTFSLVVSDNFARALSSRARAGEIVAVCSPG